MMSSQQSIDNDKNDKFFNENANDAWLLGTYIKHNIDNTIEKELFL